MAGCGSIGGRLKRTMGMASISLMVCFAWVNAEPPTIGDMSIRRAVVQDFAVLQNAVAASLQFSPDSSTLVCGLDDGRVLMMSVPKGEILRDIRLHEGAVTGVTLSPDGRWLASSGEDGWVQITDLLGKHAPRSLAHAGVVHEAEFSPKGTYLLSAGEERRVRIWEVASWEERASIRGHTDTIYALAVSPAEDLLVTGSGDRDPSIRLWDLVSGNQLQQDLYEGEITDIEYCPRTRDRYASIAGSQRTIRMWDVDTGAMRHNVGRFTATVNDIAYSSLGNTLVAVCEDGTLFFTTMPSWTEKRRIQWDEPLRAVAFSQSRQYIAFGDASGGVFLLYVPE